MGAVEIELLHPVVAGIGHVDSVRGHGNAHGLGELTGAGALGADRGEGVAHRVVLLEPVVAGVGDPDHTGRVDVGVLGIGELPDGASGAAVRGHSDGGQVGIEPLDPVSAGVDRPDAAVRTDSDRLGPGERAKLGATRAHVVHERAVGAEPLDAVVEAVHHVDLTVRRDVHAVRLGEARDRRLGPLDGVRHRSVGVEHPEAPAPEVRAVEVAIGVDSNPSQMVVEAGVAWRVVADLRVAGAATAERPQPLRRGAADVPPGDPAVACVGDVDGVTVVGEHDVVREVQLALVVPSGGTVAQHEHRVDAAPHPPRATRRTP